ncbi:AAA family ATPase [Microvirga pudoricolor]|uniref:AAA family ATPase n=1 Tax=Microvirga pudoricolor TaxID=2778729 RepID=UPI00194F93FC|nr:AAA family ATPase [Microvirga pudoricolor]MBM6594835.1 AAA family ATPase [Microvirga pudoricolor]
METAATHSLPRIDAALARTEGHRDALRERAEALTRDVELAKGRLASKGDVETFIEAVHGQASRRNLQAFETLLTALVQEVLPGEKAVALDLSTERGLAALDICVRRPDGTLEDVLEDNGGALTNVIGMALRLIAVVKADVARFLALDEADCWIAPDRVPAFYKVLQDGAARLNVQCLAVSHHDLTAFADAFHIARIVGEPEGGVEVASDPTDARWTEEQSGLRFIRLVNVQAYRDATLSLSPGVNALIGPNNRGKSTFIRALRAVFYGEARDSLVRAGSKSATIEIGVAGRRTLRFTRQPRRSPVNIWSLHDPDGAVVEENGMRFETGGRAVPDWVSRFFSITKVEDLDVHIAHQKFPVFLLGETPSRRSAVLSIGQEAGYIRDMLSIHRERCAKDNALVRTGERELIDIAEALQRLEELDTLKALAANAHVQAAHLSEARAQMDRLDAGRRTLAVMRQRLIGAQSRAEAVGNLPHPDELSRLVDQVSRARERERAAGRLIELSHGLRRAQAMRETLTTLPESLPALENSVAAQNILKRLADLRSASTIARGRLSQIADSLRSTEDGMAALLDETGGLCPTCGSSIDAGRLLEHNHIKAEQATA